MTNIPPTKKEKMLMKVLVRRFSKDDLEESFSEIPEGGLDSRLVSTSAKLIGIKVPFMMDSQYLKYTIDNYENIKNNNFPNEFERMSTLYSQITITEDVRKETTYELTIPYLKSRSNLAKDEIKGNYWQYDKDEISHDYEGSDIVDSQFDFNDEGPWKENIIE